MTYSPLDIIEELANILGPEHTFSLYKDHMDKNITHIVVKNLNTNYGFKFMINIDIMKQIDPRFQKDEFLNEIKTIVNRLKNEH